MPKSLAGRSGIRRRTKSISAGLALALSVLGFSIPAQADIGDPAIKETAAGITSVPATQGKARGSGLWGFAGDVKTRSAGTVYSYGTTISPADGSLWVTDSAKIAWTSNTFLCGLYGGQIIGTICYTGDSKVLKFDLSGSDWSTGQYATDGSYSTAAAGTNAGIGANYSSFADALVLDGSGLPNGQFIGARGIAISEEGVAWVNDPDFSLAAIPNGDKPIRLINADGTEGASFGKSWTTAPIGWANRHDPETFDYHVGITRLGNGNMVITSQTPELLKEYRSDGTFVRNIYLNQPKDTAYAGDAGYRSPYAVAADPTTPANDVLVGFIDPGKGNRSYIERIDLDDCTSESIGFPAGSSRDRCKVLDRIGVGALQNGNGDSSTSSAVTFVIQVDPLTGDIYVGQRSGALKIFGSDGTAKGSFSAYGVGTANGQVQTVRGLTFDARGFMYLTVSEGSSATRVEIFARTPDPVTGLKALYSADRESIDLKWDALELGVTDDAQAPLRDYVVELSTDGGATWQVTPTTTDTANTATITGLDSEQNYQVRVSAWNEAGNGDPAVATPAALLTVANEVDASLVREHDWKIEKSVTPSNVDAEGKAKLDYEVVVTEGATKDSAWEVTGEITVANPNSEPATVDVTAELTLGSGISCTVANGADREIAGEQEQTFSYSCPISAEPQLDGEVVATATWQALGEDQDSAITTEIAASDWTITAVNDQVSVTDEAAVPGQENSNKNFGPYTWTSEGTEHLEKYSLDVTVPEGSCSNIVNIARIDDTEKYDTTTTPLCNEVPIYGDSFGLGVLDRSIDWKIDKELLNADEIAEPITSDSIGLDYRVEVTAGAVTIENSEAAGVLFLENANDTDKAVELTNSIDIPGVECVLDQTAVTVPAGDIVEIEYVCTGDPGDQLFGEHTVTVSPAEGASFEAFDIVSPFFYLAFDTNDVVTITDDKFDFDPAWEIEWQEEGAQYAEEYSLEVAVPAGSCINVDNTAMIEETEQEATVQAKVCGADPVPPTSSPTPTVSPSPTPTVSPDPTPSKPRPGLPSTGR